MYKVVLEHLQTLENNDFSMEEANVEIPIQKSTKVEKSNTNQCHQCSSSFSQVSNLWKHLKIHTVNHSAERANKCNQCDY